MKELIKDRIDVLFEKAKTGDSDAQFKLAIKFKKGHLVEKSMDQARYWAFKAASAGNESAQNYYLDIEKSTKEKLINKAHFLFAILFLLPYAEIAIGLVGTILTGVFDNGDSMVSSIAATCFGIGIVSMFVSWGTGKLGEIIRGKSGYVMGSSLGIISIHVIGIYIAVQ